ncbi:MAG TPA: flagellar basal body rod C-terminal domain-containing protein [Acetobacteraceae bacterium]|nr:flagellar basal body rod C-terminal domain-containing protein [Acetobacteraceae bacterium]
MSLDAALSIAAGGIANVSAQLALVSHNVANAGTPGYATEVGTQTAVDASGIGMGVATGPAILLTDAALQNAVQAQASTVAGLTTQQSALQAIDAVQGTPGQGQDLASLLGALGNQFSTLLNDPTSPTQQSAVVAAAGTLATQINTLSDTYTAQRQSAQNAIVAEVGTVNSALSAIGALSDQIMAAKAAGTSTADLENQRNTQVATLAQTLSVNTLVQPNGDMIVTTASGTELPTHGPADPLSTSGANVQPGSYYPGGGIQPILLGGTDVTTALTGGQLGANLTLRDTTLPTDQAELDEFSQNLASRFSAQGLTLFTDGSGAVPAGGGAPVQSGYVGFAAVIQVNPAVTATPSLVRDGTTTIAGSPTGASAFTPNPAGGPAGFSTLITRIVDFALGTDAQTGVAQPASNTTGLGPTGTLTAPYTAPAALGDIANALVGAQAAQSAATTSQLSTEQGVQTTLQGQLTTQSGVNMDTQMSQMIALQNAYGANAKVMAAVQSMFTQLLSAIQ